jgi:peptidoglycan DL-endopeptidase CwlO
MLAACATAPQVSRIIEPTRSPPRGNEPSAAQLMIDSAQSMIGQPYRFGGAEPGGFDCSGLVAYAAARAAIPMPRTATEQQRMGVAVDRAHVRAGDLIFMHLARKELHVAIALDGERFVHAPSRGGHVRVDSLAGSPYAQGFIGARRVVSSRDPT